MSKKISPGNLFYVLSTIIALLLTFDLQAKTIIFDLGDTLLKISNYAICKNIGLFSFGGLFTFARNFYRSPSKILKIKDILKKSFFDFLDFSYKTAKKTSIDRKENFEKSFHKRAFILNEPEILRQRYLGKLSNKETLDILQEGFNNYQFKNSFERNAIRNGMFWMTDSKKIGESLAVPNKDIFQILEKCKNAKNSDNSYKNKLAILSNIDRESFDGIYQNNKLLFKYFDSKNIFLSCDLKKVKPDIKIFQLVLNTTKSKPEDVIFIDDNKENCESAQSLGIKAIQFNASKDHTKKLHSKLEILGVF